MSSKESIKDVIYLEVNCFVCERIWTCPVNRYDYEVECDGVYPTEIKCPTCVQNENIGIQMEILFA